MEFVVVVETGVPGKNEEILVVDRPNSLTDGLSIDLHVDLDDRLFSEEENSKDWTIE